ncbi:hypothetical protein L7F22_050820 [Adiantum nelumboides]|nr:hypothetical protein [Adiantum nelumboides]
MSTRKEELRVANVVLYDDGSIDRSPHEPPPIPACVEPASPLQAATVDVPLNQAKGTYLRLFKPPLLHDRLPLLLYFHGGGFIFGSTTLPDDHNFLSKLAHLAPAFIVSVEYRLAPEHPLPAAYEDCIEALLWLHKQLLLSEHASHPWLSRYADFSNCFVGGDSAGANIAHHVAMWAATGLGFQRESEDLGSACASWCALDDTTCAPAMEGLCVRGVILIHPYFTCGEETVSRGEATAWKFTGVSTDHPFANPLVANAPSLAWAALPCYLVAVASDDMFAARGLAFHQGLLDAGRKSKLFISEGEAHVFHIRTPHSKNVASFVDELCAFIRDNQ